MYLSKSNKCLLFNFNNVVKSPPPTHKTYKNTKKGVNLFLPKIRLMIKLSPFDCLKLRLHTSRAVFFPISSLFKVKMRKVSSMFITICFSYCFLSTLKTVSGHFYQKINKRIYVSSIFSICVFLKVSP